MSQPYPLLSELRNESDVEQKLLWPLFTNAEPTGFGFATGEIFTKASIKSLTIDKGASNRKLYLPDYVFVLSGLPVMACDAKSPKDGDLDEALREARLYAAELNARHPAGINPCRRVIACNGKRLISAPHDVTSIDVDLSFDEFTTASESFGKLLKLANKACLQEFADDLRSRWIGEDTRYRPLNLVGGNTVRDEDIGTNDFGAQFATRFSHLFNPSDRNERLHVVRNAYVKSRRREHYEDEIDRVLKSSLPIGCAGAVPISDNEVPTPLIKALGQGRRLQDKLLLLVGTVGAGKSTFITHFKEVRLQHEDNINASTLWVHVDINKSPPSRDKLEKWAVEQIVRKLKDAALPDVDVEDIAILGKIFGPELETLKKGPLALLKPGSDKYKESISDELRKLLSDDQKHAKALGRYLAGERSKLLVLVFDNCDKGNREEQLTVFQTVRWVQSWLRCLAILPMRDVTYTTCRNIPPLDTAIKDFVFQIESPSFTQVLRRRLQLALDELKSEATGGQLSYTLDNGIEVVYPKSELGIYLSCIFKSLHEHDKLLRRTIAGLAGKDIRKAMEMFIDFCKSGHISGKEYLKIRNARGNYSLPIRVVRRVLLRQNRRFYDGEKSHLRNLFQSAHSEEYTNHFAKIAILRWLYENRRTNGPSGVRGFHRASSVVQALTPLGYSTGLILDEAKNLLSNSCMLAEHQRTDYLEPEDLVSISTSGMIHLDFVNNYDYLAACSEDTWIGNKELAGTISDMIGKSGKSTHYALRTSVDLATKFAEYLAESANREIASPSQYLGHVYSGIDVVAKSIEAEVAEIRRKYDLDVDWSGISFNFPVGSTHLGNVTGTAEFGVFVEVTAGVQGLVHQSDIGADFDQSNYRVGDAVNVVIKRVDEGARKMALQLDTDKRGS